MSKELEAFKRLKETIISSSRSDWETEYYFVRGIESTKKDFDIIEQALKRNVPMKVLAEKHYVGFGYFKCPKCGVTISPLKIGEARYNYCPDCGKALDLSD